MADEYIDSSLNNKISKERRNIQEYTLVSRGYSSPGHDIIQLAKFLSNKQTRVGSGIIINECRGTRVYRAGSRFIASVYTFENKQGGRFIIIFLVSRAGGSHLQIPIAFTQTARAPSRGTSVNTG